MKIPLTENKLCHTSSVPGRVSAAFADEAVLVSALAHLIVGAEDHLTTVRVRRHRGRLVGPRPDDME